jgi:hypothetical protein
MPQQKERYITPENKLKQKVGSGGVDKKAVERAEKVVEKEADHFPRMALDQLNAMKKTLVELRSYTEMGAISVADEPAVREIVKQLEEQSFELKANAGSFGQEMISRVLKILFEALRDVQSITPRKCQIIQVFISTSSILLEDQVELNGNEQLQAELISSLSEVSDLLAD